MDIIKAFENLPKLTEEEYKQSKVDGYNNLVGDLDKEDGVQCPLCRNKGDIMYLRDGYEILRYCSCLKRRTAIRRAKYSGLGEYLGKKLSDFEEWQPNARANKDKLVSFMREHADDNAWFIALGQSGSGKTLLCSILANFLLHKKERNVLYLTWTDFISRLKRDMMSEQADKVSKYLDEVKNAEVLFLDEVIKKYNETDLKYLVEIINYRYTNNLKTIITCERQLEELLDIDEATFGRAVEKCEGYLLTTPKNRKFNYRLRGVSKP